MGKKTKQMSDNGGNGEGVAGGSGCARVWGVLRRPQTHIPDAVYPDGHEEAGYLFPTILRIAALDPEQHAHLLERG